jgi:hypothetical protein
VTRAKELEWAIIFAVAYVFVGGIGGLSRALKPTPTPKKPGSPA